MKTRLFFILLSLTTTLAYSQRLKRNNPADPYEIRFPENPYRDPGLFLGTLNFGVGLYQQVKADWSGGIASRGFSRFPTEIGFQAMIVNPEKPLRLTAYAGYRFISISELEWRGQDKIGVVELLFGGTYLPGDPTFKIKDTRARFTCSFLGGIQDLNFGSIVSAGFHFSKGTEITGFTVELVARPFPFENFKRQGDPFSYTVKSSISLRIGMALFKGVQSYYHSEYEYPRKR